MISLDTKCSVPKQSQAASIVIFLIINGQSQGHKKLTFLNQEFCAFGTLKI